MISCYIVSGSMVRHSADMFPPLCSIKCVVLKAKKRKGSCNYISLKDFWKDRGLEG